LPGFGPKALIPAGEIGPIILSLSKDAVRAGPLRRGLDPPGGRLDPGRGPRNAIPFHRGMINQNCLAGQNVGRRSCE
jgi:hypothetical protein